MFCHSSPNGLRVCAWRNGITGSLPIWLRPAAGAWVTRPISGRPRFRPNGPLCRCKERPTDDAASKLVSDGHAVNFRTRLPEFAPGEPLLVIGKRKQVPRVATLEKSHLQRAHVDSDTRHLKGKKLEELKRIVEEDRADRAAEERVRIEKYGLLNQSFIWSLIREVPAEEYDRQEREQSGISILSWFADERGSVGEDVPAISAPCFQMTIECLTPRSKGR